MQQQVQAGKTQSLKTIDVLKLLGKVRPTQDLCAAIRLAREVRNRAVGTFRPTGAKLVLLPPVGQCYHYDVSHSDGPTEERTCELVSKMLSGEKVDCQLVL